MFGLEEQELRHVYCDKCGTETISYWDGRRAQSNWNYLMRKEDLELNNLLDEDLSDAEIEKSLIEQGVDLEAFDKRIAQTVKEGKEKIQQALDKKEVCKCDNQRPVSKAVYHSECCNCGKKIKEV